MSKIKIIMVIIALSIIARFSFPNNVSASTDTVQEEKESKEKITKVRVKNYEVKQLDDFFTLYQSPEPIKSNILVSKYEGDIVELLAKQGDIVISGSPIMRIKERGSSSNLISAKFNLQQSEVEFEAAQDLYKQRLTPKTDYLSKKSAYEKSKSLYEQAVIELDDSTIKAPFTGVLTNFDYEIGQFVEKNTEVGFIHDLSKLKVKLQIPEKYIQEVKIGNRVVLNGIKEIEGKIEYVSLVANKETQTFEAEVITNHDDSMKNIAGLTYSINVYTSKKKGIIIPTSLLSLKGQKLVLKALNERNEVYEIPVNVLKDSKEGLWVSIDTQESKLRVITVGQNLVKDKEKVDFFEDKEI